MKQGSSSFVILRSDAP